MLVDFAAVRSGQISFADATRTLQPADLRRALDELFSELDAALAQATDATVLFVPRDPDASDQSERGWPLNQIVAHVTATLDGTTAGAAILARGVQVEGQLRYEPSWEGLSTLQKVQARLKECQRMCRAFLDAWPDEPHLDQTVTPIPALGPLNAIGLSAIGIGHAQQHLDQVREVVRQAAA